MDSEPQEHHLYGSSTHGYSIGLFSKADTTSADLQLAYAANGASLMFRVRGHADRRSASGSSATATIGELAVHWTAYEDRVKEDLILLQPTAGDRVDFDVHAEKLTFASDHAGGYTASDSGGLVRFQVPAPTVQDALGRAGAATLVLEPAGVPTTATLRVDPAFLAGASYPVTIDPTTLLAVSTSPACPMGTAAVTTTNQSGRPTPTPVVLPATAATTAACPLPSAPPLPPGPGGAHLPLHQQSPDGQQTYAFWTNPRNYDIRIFNRSTGAADVELDDEDSGASLWFGLRGAPLRRSAWTTSGVATAEFDGLTARWTVSDDRVKEDLVLAMPPAGGQVVFDLKQHGLQMSSAPSGGYRATDAGGKLRFELLAPTAHDAKGQPGVVTLSLDPGAGTATLQLDPTFASAATYPIMIDPTTLLGPTAASGASSSGSSTGNPWGWGQNDQGQVGIASTSTCGANPCNPSPGQITLTNARALSGGGYHSLAATTAGTVWAWGQNDHGQLGDGTLTSHTAPAQVSGLSGITAVAGGHRHSLALKNDGTVWAWGYNAYGQLGNNSTADALTPVQVTGLSGVVAVSAGYHHSLALKNDGTVWAWGRDDSGQLGVSAAGTCTVGTTSYSCSLTPIQAGISAIRSIAAGGFHTLALKTDGTVWAWGFNDSGQLGNGTLTNATTPVQVSNLSGVAEIAAGEHYSLGLKGDGTIWAWGMNSDGELGDGTQNNATTPIQTHGFSGVTPGAASALAGDSDPGMTFDGSQGYIQSLDTTFAVAATYSLEAWIKPNSGADAPVIAMDPDHGNTSDTLALSASSGSSFKGSTSNGTDWPNYVVDSGVVSNWTAWHHVVFTVENNRQTLKIYVDGTLRNTFTAANAAHSSAISDGRVSIGWTLASWLNRFPGSIDEVALYSSTLTATQVQAHYTAGTSPSGNYKGTVVGDGPVAYWRLDDPAGSTTVADTTANNHTASIASPAVAIGQGAGFHATALKADGTVWTWGADAGGQAGDGSTLAQRFEPRRGSGLSGITLLSPGRFHSLAGNPPLPNEPAPAGTDHNPPLVNVAASRSSVVTTTGSFTSVRTLSAIPGRGPSPDFTVTYNSNDTRQTPLGTGWTHSYNIHLASPNDGSSDIILVGPQGRSDRYTFALGNFTPPAGVSTQLVQRSDGTYTATHLDQTVWTFGPGGQLLSVRDRYGNVSGLGYDANGRLEGVFDPAGRGALLMAYDQTAKLTNITDWLGVARVVQLGYTSGLLTSITDRNGKTTSYCYGTAACNDGGQKLVQITDANSHNPVTNHYDANGRVSSQSDALGNTTTYDYSIANQTKMTYAATSFDSAWHPIVTDIFESHGWLQSRASQPTNGQTDTASYTYTTNGFPSTVTDPRGNTTTFCWDINDAGAAVAGSRGNLARRIGPAVVDARDGTSKRPTTVFDYDSHNNLTELERPDGVSSTSTTDCTTNLSGTAINAMFDTNLVYDAAGVKLLEMDTHFTDPEAGATTAATKYEYNDPTNPGRVTRLISPRGNTGASPDYTFATSFGYGPPGSIQAGMLTSLTDPVGDQATFAYDAVGRRTSMVDPNGNASGGVPGDHTWTYAYDNEDRLTSSSAPAPASGGAALTSTAQYDPVGNRTTQTDPKGQISRFAYDARNLLHEVDESATVLDPASDASKIVTLYTYDNLRNLQQVVRGSGTASQVTVDYAYDGRNRIRTETQHPSTGTTLVTSFTYDGNSNMVSRTDPMGQSGGQAITYSYDALNRRTAITYPTPPAGLSGASNVSFSYDLDGNRKSMTTGTSPNNYCWDERDALTSVSTTSTTCPLGIPAQQAQIQSGYRYDLDGNRAKVIYPGGTGQAVSYTYDKADRLQQMADWANRSTSYTYNPDGSAKQSTNVNGTTATYSYDNAIRLKQVLNQKAGGTTISQHAYTLDAMGNRTQNQENLNGTNTTFNYDYDHLYRFTCLGTGTACPNSGTTGTYQCNEANIDTYCYNPVGNRINQDLGGTTTSYTYDGADRLTSGGYASNDNGDLTTQGTNGFGWDVANRLTSATMGTTSASYSWDGDGLRTGKVVNGTSTSYTYDLQSPLPLVLDDGTLQYVWGATGVAYSVNKSTSAVTVYHQDGLGSTRALTDSGGNVTQTYAQSVWGTGQSSTGQPFQWTGQQFDPETGFTFLRARSYLSSIGRFTSRDSFPGVKRSPTSFNRYIYANQNPINFTDPTGRCFEDACVVEFGAAAACVEWCGLILAGAAALGASAWMTATNAGQNLVNTLQPGAYAGDSIPARGPGRDFTPSERQRINDIGADTGCHTCGSTDPGTVSGNFVPDHQPVSKLNRNGDPQELYPQCIQCSRTQGGQVRRAQQNGSPPSDSEGTSDQGDGTAP